METRNFLIETNLDTFRSLPKFPVKSLKLKSYSYIINFAIPQKHNIIKGLRQCYIKKDYGKYKQLFTKNIYAFCVNHKKKHYFYKSIVAPHLVIFS